MKELGSNVQDFQFDDVVPIKVDNTETGGPDKFIVNGLPYWLSRRMDLVGLWRCCFFFT